MAKAASAKTTRKSKAAANSVVASRASAPESVSADAAATTTPTGKLGALRRKHGLAVSSEKTETGRVYRIAGEPA